MQEVIAIIELAPGNVGWYDSLTGIHLSLTKKTAYIYKNFNVTNIREAIKEGKIKIITGSPNLTSGSVSSINDPVVFEAPKALIKEQPKEIQEIIEEEISEAIEESEPTETEEELEVVEDTKDFKKKQKKNRK